MTTLAAEPGRIVMTTKRLRLREWTPCDDDIQAAFEIYRHGQVMRYLGRDAKPLTDLAGARRIVAKALERYAKWGFGLWAVELAQTDEVIGNCGLHVVEEQEGVELGYHIHPRHWRQGYATEAAAAVKEYALETLRMKRLVAFTAPGNGASRRVLEKIGMREERLGEFYGEELCLFVVST